MIIEEFIVRALFGGIGTAIAAGPLGCFVVWRRMAYFGTTLSHAALLGGAIGLILHIDVTIAVVAVCVAIALLLALLQQKGTLPNDTVLGILDQGTLALGILVIVTFLQTMRVDLLSYLFGDILAIRTVDLYVIYGVSLIALAIVVTFWKSLLTITVDEEIATAEGINVLAMRLILTLLIAMVIAIGMKVVGALLIVYLLILPASTAQQLSRSPEQMAIVAASIGVASVMLGLAVSLYTDTPTGPTIAVAATGIFIATQILFKSSPTRNPNLKT